jgi:hypothetical protein
MFINICKNWLHNAHVGGSPLSITKFIEIKQVLINKNEDVIALLGLLNMDENNCKI